MTIEEKLDGILFRMLAVYDVMAHKLYCSLENDINSEHDCKTLSASEAKHQILELIKEVRINTLKDSLNTFRNTVDVSDFIIKTEQDINQLSQQTPNN